MITLLEKKDKDRRFIKNWRPISLMNVNMKIASKAIARRLETILPELIHHNQNGFVKGRSGILGILVAIDFEKAFDSLDHTYLLKVLEKQTNKRLLLLLLLLLFIQMYQAAF